MPTLGSHMCVKYSGLNLDFRPRPLICLFACIFASIYNHHESNWSSNLFLQSASSGFPLGGFNLCSSLLIYETLTVSIEFFFLFVYFWLNTLHLVCASVAIAPRQMHVCLCNCDVVACMYFLSSFIELMKRALKINSVRKFNTKTTTTITSKIIKIVHIRPITLGEILKNVL